MAFRSDISVDWTSSPRIITVAAPSTEITMQDLHDTLVTLEAQLENMDSFQIVSSGGKEVLDETTSVGITLTLLNAQIGFEDRLDWTQCTISGGNLVAVDTDIYGQPFSPTVPINPINPTAFVNIDRTSSSSGTLQEQDSLNYSSYQNAVWVDTSTSTIGVLFPSGTRQYPVNNMQDAIAIANDKGFDTIQVIGNYTFQTGDNIEGFTIIGQNSLKSLFTIQAGALTAGVEIKEASVTGILDGNSLLRECYVHSLQYFSGYLERCVIGNTTIILGDYSQAMFIDCWSGVAGFETPTIDVGGTGQSLAIRGYSGGIKIVNKTGTDPVSIDMNSGHLNIDSSCVAGDIYARGVFQFTNNSGGTVIHTKAKVNTMEDDIPQQTIDGLFLEDVNGYLTP